MANRIQAAIVRLQAAIEAQLKEGKITQDKLDELNKQIDMPFDDYCRFQELKSADMGTHLTLEEAQTIYQYLGNVPEQFNRQSLAVKVVLTKTFAELLRARMTLHTPF